MDFDRRKIRAGVKERDAYCISLFHSLFHHQRTRTTAFLFSFETSWQASVKVNNCKVYNNYLIV